MKKGIAYLVGAGDFDSREFKPNKQDLVIAADGGYDSLKKMGLRADLLLGDLDSVRHLPRGVARLKFPVKKDLTDMALGLKVAKGRGYRRFLLFGALGKRLDHTLANLHLLAGLSQEGFEARIMAGNLVIYAVTSGCLCLPPVRKGRRVSVFCWGGEAAGVHIKGLLYSLRNATINSIEPLGVSNEGLGQPAKIRVRDGTLLVFREI